MIEHSEKLKLEHCVMIIKAESELAQLSEGFSNSGLSVRESEYRRRTGHQRPKDDHEKRNAAGV